MAIRVCDVADLKSIDNLVEFTKQTYGNIGILVANAGVSNAVHVSDVTEEIFDYIVNINYKGIYFTVQRFVI